MKQLYFNNGTWYQIISIIRSHNVSNKDGVVNMDALKAWRDHLGGDHVLKQNEEFYICHTVQEPEWEEIVEETNSPVEV